MSKLDEPTELVDGALMDRLESGSESTFHWQDMVELLSLGPMRWGGSGSRAGQASAAQGTEVATRTRAKRTAASRGDGAAAAAEEAIEEADDDAAAVVSRVAEEECGSG